MYTKDKLLINFIDAVEYARAGVDLLITYHSSLNYSEFGDSGNACYSPNAKELTDTFKKICKENNILSSPEECFNYIYELPEKYQQLSLFLD